jgi:hypothetical protein
MAVMQQLPDVGPTVTHDLKPTLRDHPQFARLLVHPALDSWIPLCRIGKPKQSAHGELIESSS